MANFGNKLLTAALAGTAPDEYLLHHTAELPPAASKSVYRP